MPRYNSPASAGADSLFLKKVRELVPVVEQFEYTSSKSSLLFFQIGHIVTDVGEFEESGAPM